jgi:L-amino acid N-acyltransferase YncA
MTYHQPRPFVVTAPAPAGVILAGVCVSQQRLILAAELVEVNAEYLTAQLDANADYKGITMAAAAYLIMRAQQAAQPNTRS